MPPPGGTTPPIFGARDDRSPFLKDDVQMRIDEKTTEVPNWFTGKKTYIGLAVMLAAAIASRYHVMVPVQDISNWMALLEQNWGLLAEIFGGIFTIYGLIAKQLRHDKEVEVVKEVAKEAVVEVRRAEAVMDDTKAALSKKTVEIANLKAVQSTAPPTPKSL